MLLVAFLVCGGLQINQEIVRKMGLNYNIFSSLVNLWFS